MALNRSPDYQTSFGSIDLSVQENYLSIFRCLTLPARQLSHIDAAPVQEKNFNIDIRDGGHFGFPIRMIVAALDLQVTSI